MRATSATVRRVAVAAREAAKQAAAAPEVGDGSSTGANAEALVIF